MAAIAYVWNERKAGKTPARNKVNCAPCDVTLRERCEMAQPRWPSRSSPVHWFMSLLTQVIPTPSEEQLILVELVRSVSAMRTETVMQTVKDVLKQPPAIAKEKVRRRWVHHWHSVKQERSRCIRPQHCSFLLAYLAQI